MKPWGKKIKRNLKLHNPVKHLKWFVKIGNILIGISRIASQFLFTNKCTFY